MLSAHPDLCWVQEFELAVDRIEGEGWPDLEAYHAFLATHRIARAVSYAIDPALSYPELVGSFLEQQRVRAGKPRVGATVHRHFDRLLRLWPTARFIHLVRDPRDVAPSCIPMGWAGNVWTAIERWVTAERLWSALQERVPAERRLEVRFEDLICHPETELERVCAFLGISYDPAMLRYPESTSYERPNPSLTQQWRKKLSPREIQLVESRVGDLLEARGYAPSGEPARPPGALERMWLQLQDRAARIRHRVRIFGLRLFVADLVSRAGFPRWHHDVKLRLNAVTQSRLK